MLKNLLIFAFILQLGNPSYSQNKPSPNLPSPDPLQDAQDSSQGLNFPSRRTIDGGLIVLGISAHLISRIKPKTQQVLEAQRAVQEIKARLWAEAPEMAAAREKYQKEHDLRTLEETAEQRKAWDKLANDLNRMAGVEDSKAGIGRVFTEEEIKTIREADLAIRGGALRDKGTLVSLAEKTARIKEAQEGIQEAEKLQNLQRKTIGIELTKAEYSLKIEEGLAFRKFLRVNPRWLKYGGIVLVGLAGWDLIRNTVNNTVASRIATPDELGKMAVALTEEGY